MIGQSMPRSIAVAIVDAVAADSQCRRLIPVVSPYNVAQRSAGTARNLTNATMAALAGAAEFVSTPSGMHGESSVHRNSRAAREWWQDRGDALACDKIASATAAAITRQIGKAIPRWVRSATDVSRQPSRDVSNIAKIADAWLSGEIVAYHSATGVTVGDGKTYVFDWHETLALRCPVIYRSLDDWKTGREEFSALFSTFQGWG